MKPLSCVPSLLLCASAAAAGTFPITSFAPDTAAVTAHGGAERRPMWLGIQWSPSVGGAELAGHPHAVDADGTPWVGVTMAWPWTSPCQPWLAFGYERWEYALDREADPFGGVLLPFISPVRLDHYTVRTGFDGLIGRDHAVSALVGAGWGFGYVVTRVGQLPGTDWTISLEGIAHGLLYVRTPGHTRIGAGVSAGPTLDLRDGGDLIMHWELELRLEHAGGGGPPPGR